MGKFVDDADTDSTGNLNFEEFKAFLKKLDAHLDAVAEEEARKKVAEKSIDLSEIDKVFNTMDADGCGTLNIKELRAAYAALLWQKGKRVEKKKVNKWASKAMRKYDHDQSKDLGLEEFRALVLAG